jgi:hypothetical protein
MERPDFWLLTFSNFITSRLYVWKVGETIALAFWDRPTRLLARHSFSYSEVFGLWSHVIVVNVEHHMLPLFSLSRSL